jgi:hypothetical protein
MWAAHKKNNSKKNNVILKLNLILENFDELNL